jgi:hypothetical protein
MDKRFCFFTQNKGLCLWNLVLHDFNRLTTARACLIVQLTNCEGTYSRTKFRLGH